eukprot:Colp12_sorted_trinity150504_noHs@28002
MFFSECISSSIHAPPEIYPERSAEAGDAGCCWWIPFSNYENSRLEESFAHVEATLREKGPFDGVLGFSQGAALASMLAARHHLSGDTLFRFIVVVAGFIPDMSPHFNSDIKIKTPSLHVYGTGDQVIVPSRSQTLAQFFENPVEVQHEGGHFVPANA